MVQNSQRSILLAKGSADCHHPHVLDSEATACTLARCSSSGLIGGMIMHQGTQEAGRCNSHATVDTTEITVYWQGG